MTTNLTLKELLNRLPLATAEGIRKGDMTTMITIEDIIDGLNDFEKKEFYENRINDFIDTVPLSLIEECIPSPTSLEDFNINDIVEYLEDEGYVVGRQP